MPVCRIWQPMMKVEIDIVEEKIPQLKEIKRRVWSILIGIVQEEIASKTYKDQTTTLVTGTEVRDEGGSSDGFILSVQQGAEYGKYVQKKGFSRFSEIVEAAIPMIERVLRG